MLLALLYSSVKSQDPHCPLKASGDQGPSQCFEMSFTGEIDQALLLQKKPAPSFRYT